MSGRIEPATEGLKILVVAMWVAALGATLSAGLWPFSFHQENQAYWKPERGGLSFGGTGMAISNGKFSGLGKSGENGCSIEIWVRPSLAWNVSTLLSFYNPQADSHIQLRQSEDDIAFTRTIGPDFARRKQQSIFVDQVLHKDQSTFITLTAAGGMLNVYINGVLRRSTRHPTLLGTDFAGTLVVANTPYENSSFDGIVRGLAIYDRALPRQEVEENFQTWQKNPEALAASDRKPYALYLFDENQGTVVHNHGTAGPDLEIPKNYFLFEQGFLVPFWREYRKNWDYAKDLAINIFGLMPLGFCSAAVFGWRTGRRRNLLYSTTLGFCTSLTIEILQAYIPTRVSGTTDLITNTLGTFLGAWLYLNTLVQGWIRHLGLIVVK